MLFALLNLALCAIGYAIAYREERWSHGQMGPRSLPYLKHGGMWADWFLLTPIAYIVQDSILQSWTPEKLTISFVSATVVSIIAHIFWAWLQPIPGHIVDPRQHRLPVGGYYHMAYTAIALGLILQFYLFTPEADKLAVSILLTVWVVPSTIQPGWYVAKVTTGKGKIDGTSWTASTILWVVIWIGYLL